jgi:hypothetical protein
MVPRELWLIYAMTNRGVEAPMSTDRLNEMIAADMERTKDVRKA